MDENSTGYFLTLILKLSLYRKLLGLLCLLSGLGGVCLLIFLSALRVLMRIMASILWVLWEGDLWGSAAVVNSAKNPTK